MQSGKKQKKSHSPVLIQEVIDFLILPKAHLNNRPRKNSHTKRIVDATVGTGGHSVEIIKRGVKVLGIDADKEMLSIAERNLVKACPTPNNYSACFKLIQGNFRQLEKLATESGFNKVDGIILDLGISNLHYLNKARGFSFSEPEAVLDMRLEREVQQVTAANLLNTLRHDQIIDLFKTTLNKQEATRLSNVIVSKRKGKEIKTVGDFLQACSLVFRKRGRIHPATRAFLALRIAVNTELENLKEVLPQALELLKVGGRLEIISFHSGEDAIVKKFFRRSESSGKAKLITKKPVIPGVAEVKRNPLSRSAKLRVLEKYEVKKK